MNEQEKTPFLSALIDYVKSKPVQFDVPGHKLGNFQSDLSRLIGSDFYSYDINAPIGMDNLFHPTGVINEAQDLAAKAFHADHCIFSVNGSTGGILAAIMGCLKTKEKIILPRNVHKSVINALIVSGAIPVFVNPVIDEDLKIACGVTTEDYIKAMDDNPTARAVFVINPTYFGVVSDLKEIVREAHKRNMIVIADEAHGSNFYFSEKLPCSAMECNCDIAVLSMHKNSGSLTQTSMILLKGTRVNFYDIQKSFAMFTSTSPNHILIASLESARKEMYFNGKELLDDRIKMAEYARDELNRIPGIYAYGKEFILKHNSSGVKDIDLTKIVIDVRGLNTYGYDVFQEIKQKFNIQLELGEIFVVLAIIGPGTTWEQVRCLVDAFQQLSKSHLEKKIEERKIRSYNYTYPCMLVSPREAYDAPSLIVSITEAIGEISAETIMAYPPGIPLVIPGEIITQDTVNLIEFYAGEGGVVLKDTQPGMIKVIDRSKWYLADEVLTAFHSNE